MTNEANKILSFIRTFLKENGASPSIREIASYSDISPKSVLHFLFELESSGMIKRSPYRARTIQLMEQQNDVPLSDVSLIPLVGMSAGGPMILAEQNIEEYIPVSTKLIGTSKDTFLLKVKGSSMKPYIENGDIAIIRSQSTANKGDIIVAAVQDEGDGYSSTIKEYYPSDNNVILKPINPDNEPILVSRKHLHIQGIVKGVIKHLG